MSLTERLLELDITTSVFSDSEWLANRRDYWLEREIRGTYLEPNEIGGKQLLDGAVNYPIHKILCRGPEVEIAVAKSFVEQMHVDDIRFFSDRPTALEISPSSSSKVTALLSLLGHHGHSEKEVLVFGDADNDLDMITHFQHSVAMGNGTERLKNSAAYVIGSNNDPSIADFLNANTQLDQ